MLKMPVWLCMLRIGKTGHYEIWCPSPILLAIMLAFMDIYDKTYLRKVKYNLFYCLPLNMITDMF